MEYMKSKTSFLKGAIVAFALLSAAFSCTTEDEILDQGSPETQEPLAIAEEEADVASVTVAGIYTEFAESVDCATCTFTVPANVKTVDGTKLGIKPGSVVCISAGRRAGEVEFINIVGTEQQPIIIGNCDE